MNTRSLQFAHILIFSIGLVMVVGGIASGKPGAWIVGMIMAAVNFQWWQRSRSGRGDEKTNS